MKKNKKRLDLGRETLRRLDRSHLRGAAAGATTTPALTTEAPACTSKMEDSGCLEPPVSTGQNPCAD